MNIKSNAKHFCTVHLGADFEKTTGAKESQCRTEQVLPPFTDFLPNYTEGKTSHSPWVVSTVTDLDADKDNDAAL